MLDDIIHKDQNGFLKGRDISHKLRTILDVADFTEQENIDVVLILFDFYKAFDPVHYKPLFNIMRWFGYGVNWISVLFNNFRLAAINNGYTSEYFSPTRGLFQGNPIASYQEAYFKETPSQVTFSFSRLSYWLYC